MTKQQIRKLSSIKNLKRHDRLSSDALDSKAFGYGLAGGDVDGEPGGENPSSLRPDSGLRSLIMSWSSSWSLALSSESCLVAICLSRLFSVEIRSWSSTSEPGDGGWFVGESSSFLKGDSSPFSSPSPSEEGDCS